jgi:tetratricopeptide (TPR) repeat protein
MAIQATPPGADAYMKVARNLRALGKDKAAAKAARLALEEDSTLLPAMDLLAGLAFRDGRFEEAAGLARQEVEVDPLHANGYFLQGQVFLKQDQPGQAEKIWLKGLEQVPDSTLLANRLVDFYLSQARFPEAEAIAARLQSFAPSDDSNQARLHLLLGRISEAKGMLFEARRSYRMAAGLAPDVLPYLLRVARMEEKMGNWDEAERIYKQLLAARFRPGEIGKRLEAVERHRTRDKDRAMMEIWVKDGAAGPD